MVAVAQGGRVYMGGDSALTADDFSQLSMAETKVFFKGEFLIGGSGSARGGQLMRFRFQPPKHPRGMNADEYMATLWVDALREVFKQGGHMYFDEAGGEESSTTNALIGYRGNIWLMEGGDLQIERLRDAYAVIGSGGVIALGALFATKDIVDLDPVKRVKLALDAACRYSAACRPPYTVEVLEPGRKPDPPARKR